MQNVSYAPVTHLPARPDRWSTRPGATARRWPSEQMIRLLCRNVPERLRSDMTALDVGCGNGRNSVALAQMGFARVVAVDPSPTLVETARQRARDAGCALDLLVGGLPDLPCEAGTIDAAVAWGVMYVVGTSDEARAAMNGLARTISPGGMLITDWRTDCDELLRYTKERIDPQTVRLSDAAPLNMAGALYSFWSEAAVRHVHTVSGFEIVDLQREEIREARSGAAYSWWQICAKRLDH